MTTPFKSNGLALLIGINDYSTYAAATGNPPDAIHLKGGAHDTVAIERCCRDLGMLAENIHVLRNDIASPGNDGDVPSKIGEDGRPLLPTREEILRQIGWLRAQLEGSEEKHGLLWYSGHSAHTKEKGLLLCPSDTGKDFANAIPFKELGELLGPAAAKKLTVVLDCCHGGAIDTTDGKRASTLGGDPIEPTAWIEDTDLRIGAVVLAACAPGELAQQSWFAGIPHGAFTWALLCVANQWAAKEQGNGTRMTLTYRQLVKRATALLSSLDFDQTPQIWPQPAGALTVLQTGNQNESADDHPDANRGHIQIDGGTKGYLIWTLSGTAVLGSHGVLATNTRYTYNVNATQYAYAAATEHWNMQSRPSEEPGKTLIFTRGTEEDWPRSGGVSGYSGGMSLGTQPEAMSWSAGTPGMIFVYSTSSQSGNFGVDLSDLSFQNGSYTGNIVWWYCGTAGPTAGSLISRDTTLTWASTPAAPPGLTWHQMTQRVENVTFG